MRTVRPTTTDQLGTTPPNLAWIAVLCTILGGLGGTATVLHYFRIDPPWVRLTLNSWRFPTKAMKPPGATRVWGPRRMAANSGAEFTPGAVVTYGGSGNRNDGLDWGSVSVAHVGITSAQGVALAHAVSRGCGYWVRSSNSNSLQMDVEYGAGVAILVGGDEFTLTVMGASYKDASVVVRRKPD